MVVLHSHLTNIESHFMPETLLGSQLHHLEFPEDSITILT
jgi:gluconate kinase